MKLSIATPKKLALEMEIASVSVPTPNGEITILPKHAHLLSLLREGIITIKSEKAEQYMAIGGGYMETDGNTVHILVSRAYNQDEIDEKSTEEAIQNAKKVLAETKDRTERSEATSLLRRSVVDLKLLGKVRHKSK